MDATEFNSFPSNMLTKRGEINMLKRSSWMAGKSGIMIHYLPPCVEGPNGEKYTSADDSVNSFDVPAFIK